MIVRLERSGRLPLLNEDGLTGADLLRSLAVQSGDLDLAGPDRHEITRILEAIDQGETELAVELYALASCHPYVANSRWFEQVYGRKIAAVVATLPPEVVAAARERGQARDMEATAAELLAELGGSGVASAVGQCSSS